MSQQTPGQDDAKAKREDRRVRGSVSPPTSMSTAEAACTPMTGLQKRALVESYDRAEDALRRAEARGVDPNTLARLRREKDAAFAARFKAGA